MDYEFRFCILSQSALWEILLINKVFSDNSFKKFLLYLLEITHVMPVRYMLTTSLRGGERVGVATWMFYGNPGNRDKARWDSWLVRRLRVGKTEHPHSAPRKRVLYRWLRRFWVHIITHVYECIVKYAHIWFNYRSDIKKRDWYPPHSFRYNGRFIQIENIYYQDDIHHLV